MLKTLIRNQIAAFERNWGYDASYLRAILDDGGVAGVLAVNGVTKLGAYRKDVPPAPYFAAAIASARAADCGPCTQLVVTMAERAGVEPKLLRALLSGEDAGVPDDVRLARDFALLTLARDVRAGELRDAIVRRWGKRALISIAFAITSSQIYPTLKYALGYGHTCVRVTVGGENVTVAQPSLAS